LNAVFSGAIEQTLRAICIIGQITTVWFGYDIVAGLMLRNRERLYAPWFLNSVFFVYCSHGFILNFVTPFCGQGGGAFIVTIAGSLFVAWLMRRFIPTLYSFLTGGR
jgi:hypothetical protein